MGSFDLIVVGAGSGLSVANAAAQQGLTVAIIERGPLGGTCLNRGCIPSKELIYRADVLRTIRGAERFGIDVRVDRVDFEGMVEETNRRVREEAREIEKGLRGSKRHELFKGEARFVEERTLEVALSDGGTARVEGESIVIAAGTRPALPRMDGLEDVGVLTSRESLRLKRPPNRLVIIGGGYIAAELGHFFGSFGTDVTIIGRRTRLLPEADEEIGRAFTGRFSDRFTVLTGYEAVGIEEHGDEIDVHAEPYMREGGGSRTVAGDEVLVAAGRRPNTDTLDVQAAGVETDKAGFIVTDEALRTTAEGVWALGDIVGEHLLKHNANHEARTVAHNLLSDHVHPVDYAAMPFAVFSHPEVAGVGERAQDLRQQGASFATSTYAFEDTARGTAMKVEGVVKVIAGPEGELLGCHILGPQASVLIQEVVNVMRRGSATVRDLQEPVHIHPALPEVVHRASMGPFQEAGSPDEGSRIADDQGEG